MRSRIALVGTLLFAYLLSFFFRSTNAVLADDFTRDAGLGPEQLGAMTSLFYVAFAVAQLPLGAALDRWGPRVVTPLLMLAAVAGSLVTAAADGFLGLAVGRALIGFGMAGVLMGSLKAFAAWFPPARFATVSSVFVGLGSLGALGATTPLVALAGAVGWRGVFVVAAAATLLAALAIVAVVRAAPSRPSTATAAATDGATADDPLPDPVGFARIFASAAFWRLALLVFTLTGGLFALQGLWGGPFMTGGLGLPRTTAAALLLVLGSAATTGYLIAGPVAGRWGIERTMASGATLALVVLVALAAVPAGTPVALLAALWAAYGLGAGANVLGYAAARATFPSAPGRAVTAVNVFAIGGSALLQAGLGVVVGAVASGVGSADAPPLLAYRAALVATAALLAAALAVFSWRRSAP
ncbi:MAG: MFS transporter [Trueperaceae bacterium]|nr:MFS transporter [Trueperaceae bacterium]